MLTSLQERRRKYTRARFNYYAKTCKSLAASTRYLENHGDPHGYMEKYRSTLVEFTAERDSHYAAWQELEKNA